MYTSTVSTKQFSSALESRKSSTHYFFLFLLLHTLLWTLGTYFARPSLPHDTLESITWGLQWQWGYHKHPFLTAWLCAGIFSLFQHADWSLYLLAQVLVTTTFIAVWYLAKQFLPLRHALIATLLLEGVLFYNINSFNLTSDTLQSPLWALLALFFYHALTTEKIYYWLLTSLLAACCICTKYQGIIFLVPMLFLCLKHPVARASFKKAGIYWSMLVFLLLISPHLIWLYQHDFITVTYAQTAAADYTATKTIWGHLLYPLLALANDLFIIVGVFILIWPFYTKNKEQFIISSFQWHFLIILGFGPVVLTLILGIFDGDYFPPRWSTPYFFLIGIIVMSYLKPRLTKENIKKFAISFVLFSSLLFSIRMLSLTVFYKVNNDAFLPNKEMAISLNQLWRERYHSTLPYIAGSNYLVSLISPYLPDKSKPFLNWQLKENPWVNEMELGKKGALFIWDEGINYAWDHDGRITAHLPEWVLYRFPELIILPNTTFYRLSNNYPLIIGVAILPPRVV